MAIGVVAILSGIIIPLVLKNIRDSQIARAKNDLHVIAAAMASQLRDTGGRPRAAGGPNGATGVAGSYWFSTANMPAVVNPAAGAPVGVVVAFPAAVANQTFTNLFSIGPGDAVNFPLAHIMFNTVAGAEFSYKGPYLAADMAGKSDPWGRAYVILGYDATGEAHNGPIWVVSAGPSGQILSTNLVVANNHYREVWDPTEVSAGNIAVRIN